MARETTLGEARDRLRAILGIQNDSHFPDEELNEHLASAAAEMWDTLVNSGLAEQYVKYVEFTTTAGTMEYDLEAEDGSGLIDDDDFYKVHALYVNEGQGHLRPVNRVNPAEIVYFTAPQQAVTMRLYYIPCAPTFYDAGLGTWNDEEAFEGFNGWEELWIVTAGINVKIKQQDDYNQLYRRKKELEQRVQSMANTDWSQPCHVVRRYKRDRNKFFPFTSTVTAWGLRGGKLELYSNDSQPYV